MIRPCLVALVALAVVAVHARADQQAPQPTVAPRAQGESPNSAARLSFRFAAGSSVMGILRYIAEAGGFNVVFDGAFNDRSAPFAITLDDATLEQALDLVLTSANLFQAPLDARTIVVAPDTLQNRQRYEPQVVRTFRLRSARAAELASLVIGVVADPLIQRPRPQVQPDEVANTLTVRGSQAAVESIARIIEDNDVPAAEVVVDVRILEVDRARAAAFGTNLAAINAGIEYAPTGLPSKASPGGGWGQVDTLLAGLWTSDFFVTLPDVVVGFLETDAHTRVLARPSLRGSAGTRLTAAFGDEIPVPSTTFSMVGGDPGAVGRFAAVTYRPVGIVVSVTPRVTADDEVVLELEVEHSRRAADVSVAGQMLPSFGTRRVRTTLRLRDGESSLLAGLVREEDRRLVAGLLGTTRVPGMRELLAVNARSRAQTDLLILLTPHIVRSRGNRVPASDAVPARQH